MKQGVSVFDRDGKLLLWNDKYIEIFEKPLQDIYKGVSLRELVLAEKARGDFTDDVDQMIADLQSIQIMGSNEISGFEALIRWGSKEHETQFPDEFIPLAEDLGLIQDIGNWVIKTSIAEAKDWRTTCGWR